ncbi:MAG: SPOR domain-containing protein [Gammaproteobacteria bacterium]
MDFLLKQRLIGAVVLVALGVIFIPMLLEDNVRPVVPEIKAIPEPEALPKFKHENKLSHKNNALPLPPVSLVTKKSVVQEIKTEKKQTVLKQPLPPIEPSKKTAEKKKKAKAKQAKVIVAPKKVKTAKIRESLQSWVVQAGSFTRQENAFSLRDKLRKAGFATQVDRVVLESGITFRVRVGPYSQTADAEKAMSRIGKKFRLKPKILRYP